MELNIRVIGVHGKPTLFPVKVYKEFEFKGFKFFIHRKVAKGLSEVPRQFICSQYDTGLAVFSLYSNTVDFTHESAIDVLESKKKTLNKTIKCMLKNYGRANPSLTGL